MSDEQPDVPFLYPLKTVKNLWLSGGFRGKKRDAEQLLVH